MTTAKKKMGGESDDRFDSSTSGIVYQGRQHNRADPGFKGGVAEGSRFGYANAYLLYKSGRARPYCDAARKTQKGEVLTCQED